MRYRHLIFFLLYTTPLLIVTFITFFFSLHSPFFYLLPPLPLPLLFSFFFFFCYLNEYIVDLFIYLFFFDRRTRNQYRHRRTEQKSRFEIVSNIYMYIIRVISRWKKKILNRRREKKVQNRYKIVINRGETTIFWKKKNRERKK